MNNLDDISFSRKDYYDLMNLYVQQMRKTVDLQDEIIELNNKNIELIFRLKTKYNAKLTDGINMWISNQELK